MANDLFPIDKDEGPERIRVVSQLTKDQHSDLEFVVDVWNEMHKALGRKGRGWAVMSVAQRMVVAGVESFLRKYGGRPGSSKEGAMSAEERAAFMKRAVADVKRHK